MKKFIAVILIISMILPAVSLADLPDISNLSIDELYLLQGNVAKEILSRSEWTEVTVPVGYYVIGEDIPEGHWTIKYTTGECSLIEYYKEADETGKRPKDTLYDYVSFAIGDPNSKLSSIYDMEHIDLDLKAGYHLVISFGAVIFEPFTGRNSPFFNK